MDPTRATRAAQHIPWTTSRKGVRLKPGAMDRSAVTVSNNKRRTLVSPKGAHRKTKAQVNPKTKTRLGNNATNVVDR